MRKLDNFSFDVTGLTAYVDEQQTELRAKQVLEGRSISLMSVQDGVKGSQRLHLMDDTITWQDGTSCVVTAAGDTTLTEKTITTVDIAIMKSYCNKDLVGKWAQILLQPGAQNELLNLPFEEQLINYIIAKNSGEIDNAIWRSDSALSNNLGFFDGFVKTLNADGSVLEANTTGVASITTSNAYDVVLSVARKLPEAVVESGDAAIFCGRRTFDKVKDNLFDLNLFHVPVANDDVMSLVVPGTGITLYSVPGLNATDYIYAGKRSEFIVGTDIEGDFSSIEVWYEKKDDSIYIRNRFRLGIQYPFSDQMVKFTLAAS